jgi:hypothetical protein
MIMFFRRFQWYRDFTRRSENERRNEFKKRINELKKLLLESKSISESDVYCRDAKNLSNLSATLGRIEDFDNKPFWQRWWLKLTGDEIYISRARSWLASQICMPFMNCNNLEDSNFNISKRYLKVFPSKWKKILSRLHGCFTEGPIYKKIPATIVRGVIVPEHIEDVLPHKNSSLLIHSKLRELKVEDAKQKEVAYNACSLFMLACGFVNLDTKKFTANLILEELHKLFSKFSRDNITQGFTDENGVWVAYYPAILDEMISSIHDLIILAKEKFNDINGNDEELSHFTVPIRYSVTEEKLSLGSEARKEFDSKIEKILLKSREKMKIHQLNQKIADLQVQRDILIRPEGVEEPCEEYLDQPGLPPARAYI